jgi:hypothetical protein
MVSLGQEKCRRSARAAPSRPALIGNTSIVKASNAKTLIVQTSTAKT